MKKVIVITLLGAGLLVACAKPSSKAQIDAFMNEVVKSAKAKKISCIKMFKKHEKELDAIAKKVGTTKRSIKAYAKKDKKSKLHFGMRLIGCKIK